MRRIHATIGIGLAAITTTETALGQPCATQSGCDQNIAATSYGATISGGYFNSIDQFCALSVIGGGRLNRVGDFSAAGTIGGGVENRISGAFTSLSSPGEFNTIVGGQGSVIGEHGLVFNAFIGGGQTHILDSPLSAICGGQANRIDILNADSFIGGGASNLILALAGQAPATANVVVGGNNNRITGGLFSAIGGGSNIIIIGASPGTPATGCTVAGGSGHEIHLANYGTIGGGLNNLVEADFAVVGGGNLNSVSNVGGGIFSGIDNDVDGDYGIVCGGQENSVELLQSWGFIGGGAGNLIGNLDPDVQVAGQYSAIVGGDGNRILRSDTSFIGGGMLNAIKGSVTSNTEAAAICGGQGNVIAPSSGGSPVPSYAFIGGGLDNQIQGECTLSVIGGGNQNSVTNIAASVLGGVMNQAGGPGSAIVGGEKNVTMGLNATVLGGIMNQALGTSSVAGGQQAIAIGDHSLAFGFGAVAGFDGCTVFADSNPVAVTCANPNQFVVRATGGVAFYTDTAGTLGEVIPMGSGTWMPLSDRNKKNGFAPVDPADVLERLMAMPVTTWRYNTEVSGAIHMGPMAQDFYAQFHLGGDETRIATIDSDGVQIAAIQGLYIKATTQEAELARVRAENRELRGAIGALEARLAKLEAMSATK